MGMIIGAIVGALLGLALLNAMALIARNRGNLVDAVSFASDRDVFAAVDAWAKPNGYRLVGNDPSWKDVRGMYVVLGSGPDAPSTLVWATRDTVTSAVLEAVQDPNAPGSPCTSDSRPRFRPSHIQPPSVRPPCAFTHDGKRSTNWLR